MRTLPLPWRTFLVFLLANALLSYFPLPPAMRWAVGGFGILLPFLLSLGISPSVTTADPPLYQRDFFPDPPSWIWFLLGGAAILGRFFALTSFAVWPNYDDGLMSYYALDLCRHWKWTLFFGVNQTPPLYLWGLGLVYKLFGPSLLSLWLFPAVLSLLTVPLGYWAARRYFSKSFSLIIVFLLSLGFWPIFIGRFSQMAVLVVLAECGALALLGWFLKYPRLTTNLGWVWLGLGVGIGFYVYLSWPVVALMVGVAAFAAQYKNKNSRKAGIQWLLFFLACLTIMAPLLVEAVKMNYGSYLKNLSAFGNRIPLSEQIQVSFSYISSIFWGMDPNFHTYQPVWGGYLNPVLGALFFIGILEIYKKRQENLYQWLFLAMIVFLLPGLLTRERETFRVVTVLPVLLAITALGLGRLLTSVSNQRMTWFLALVILSSAGLDIVHLEKYHQLWDSMDNWKGYAKSFERFKAYGILERISREKGPGLVFSDFSPGLCDQTLNLADYGFNALENPSLDLRQARWVALLANVNERPFLEKRFPSSRSYALSKEDRPSDGGWMLWTVPLSGTLMPAFLQWARANQALKPFIDESLQHLQGESYSRSLDLLADALPSMARNPFLLSNYWDKRADLMVKEGDISQAEICIKNAVKKGDPSANLYYRLGVLQWIQGKRVLALKSFDSAAHSPLDLTLSSQWLASKQKNP